MKTDFSRVARAYRWMEYASFGTLLEKTRFLRLPMLRDAQRALVLGDGDGRFLARLVEANSQLAADAVDFSPGMLRLAQMRVGAAKGRVTWYEADALSWAPARAGYDLIVTHFFLDCFSDEEVRHLVGRLLPHLAPGGLWINSDFAIPASGWMHWPSRIVIRGLYASFFLLAGLRTQRLPDDVSALQTGGLRLEHRAMLAGGLLKSEVWRKPGPPEKTGQ